MGRHVKMAIEKGFVRMTKARADRVICYVDGFNLYFGLRDSGLRRFYWLNIHKLAENLLRADQRLAETKYFTARIAGARRGDPPKRSPVHLKQAATAFFRIG